jgi:DNA sulfur modification protein DndD
MRNKVNLNRRKSEVQESLKDHFDVIPFALAGETLINISEQVTNERNLIEQRYKQEDVNSKINNIKQEIERQRIEERLVFDTNVRDFYENQIVKLIKNISSQIFQMFQIILKHYMIFQIQKQMNLTNL